MKYLVQDGDKVKKATMDGLEEVGDGIPIKEGFESHGTDYLPDITGKYDKEVDMIYNQELGDRKLYGYKLIGYTDLAKLEVK